MEEPRFQYLCSYRASFTEPQQMVGKAHFGRRMIAALTGGEVEGERLRGRVMPSGGDWARSTTTTRSASTRGSRWKRTTAR